MCFSCEPVNPASVIPDLPVFPSVVPDDVVDDICSFLSFTDLSNLRGVNRRLRRLVHAHIESNWNQTLSPYVKSAEDFRDLSLVSGSTVLYFVLRGTPYRDDWNANDLDVYCPLSTAASVVDYLVQREECTVARSVVNRDRSMEIFREYSNGALASVTTLRTRDNKKIDVIASTRNSPLLPITYFWGTLIANYISADTLCITYPQLTLDGVSAINPLRTPSSRAERCIKKYEERGFIIVDFSQINGVQHAPWKPAPFHCPQTYRTFQDAGCLIFRFCPDHPRKPPALFPIYNPMWKYGGAHCGGDCKAADPARSLHLLPAIE
ncbi:hypothetical protein BV25DRAFT_1817004 [Artomyces pyxidatus]|uniref:Uncharacterized protein n=1 Tax=Artomyces pyxidatus TaxID=48021 RepID=A0ACB8SDR8_9AGAM|nr:hypothetical protein BV25DRAFT_1817004 [Artomyces pyxidatus]